MKWFGKQKACFFDEKMPEVVGMFTFRGSKLKMEAANA
jgi:hypothetical protein